MRQASIPTEMQHSLKTTMVALCQEVCKVYEEDDHNYLARQIAELELADRQNAPKGMWKIIGEIQPSFQGPGPKRTCYQLKERPNGRMEEYFAKLLNSPPVSSTSDFPQTEVDLPIETGDYTRTEGQVAIQSLKDSKAPGIDSVM